MSDIAHRFYPDLGGCVCGSQWNWIVEGCASIYPLPKRESLASLRDDAEDFDLGFFECRRGHAFCARH